MDENTWLIEKTHTLLGALADIAAYINGLANYREEDENGIPTRESGLASALHTAVDKATTILASELGVEWKPIDRDSILRHGRVGLHQLLIRYGFAAPQPMVFLSNDDAYQ